MEFSKAVPELPPGGHRPILPTHPHLPEVPFLCGFSEGCRKKGPFSRLNRNFGTASNLDFCHFGVPGIGAMA